MRYPQLKQPCIKAFALYVALKRGHRLSGKNHRCVSLRGAMGRKLSAVAPATSYVVNVSLLLKNAKAPDHAHIRRVYALDWLLRKG